MATRRFSAQPTTVIRELQAAMRKMGASSLKVNQDIFTGEAEIVFDRAGRRYVFRCKKWKDSADNLRAAQLSIGYLHRALEEYGTTSTDSPLKNGQADPFQQFFAGFEALPDDSVLMLGDGSSPWWEVLGVAKAATKRDVMTAYRALARVHHPDTGGDVEQFKKLRRAYEQALQQVAA